MVMCVSLPNFCPVPRRKLRSSVVIGCNWHSQNPGSNVGGAALLFFRVIQLSVLLTSAKNGENLIRNDPDKSELFD